MACIATWYLFSLQVTNLLAQHIVDAIPCFCFVFFQLVYRNGTSSASSLGLTDLDAFSDVPTQSTVIR